jgi:hypothetical protein
LTTLKEFSDLGSVWTVGGAAAGDLATESAETWQVIAAHRWARGCRGMHELIRDAWNRANEVTWAGDGPGARMITLPVTPGRRVHFVRGVAVNRAAAYGGESKTDVKDVR